MSTCNCVFAIVIGIHLFCNIYFRIRNKALAPGIGLAVAVLLHLYSPMKVKFVQGLNSIELWRCGAQRKVF